MTHPFLQSIQEILFSPVTAFRSMGDDCPVETRGYFFRLLLVFALGKAGLAAFGIGNLAWFPDPGQFPQPGWISAYTVAAFILVLAVVILGFFALYFDTYIVNSMALRVGAKPRRHAVFRVMACGATPALLFGWIPIIGIAGILYSILLEIIGLQELLGLSRVRAVLTLALSVGAITIAAAVVFFFIPLLLFLPIGFLGIGAIIIFIMVRSLERDMWCN